MTLIAAWITNDFRVIASDACCLDGLDSPSVCQKVFANNNIAIGLYGSSTPMKREELNNILQQHQEINTDKFYALVREKLKNDICENGANIDFENRHVTHILVLTKSNTPHIICMQRGCRPYFDSLENYLKKIGSLITCELFFSEQEETNYHGLLLKYFERIKAILKFNSSEVNESSLTELFKEFFSAIYYESELKKKTIGGNKIYMAYCLQKSFWNQIEFSPILYDDYRFRKIFNERFQY
jgi:hypothetical protein